MTRGDVAVSASLQAHYDLRYDDAAAEWYEVAGRYKADNILRVCEGRAFGKVLDCGAGDGAVLKFVDVSGAFAETWAAEISDSGLSRIRARGLGTLREAVKFDGYRLPFADRSFDMAYCSHVIEHVEHPRLLLRELARVSVFQVFEIPLDYAPGVDERAEELLAYGHISVYTPSLFRFLLKSEGFVVLRERLTYGAPEVVRYNWYRNQGREKTWRSELQLALWPAVRSVRRLLRGKRAYEERGYSAYTCLAQRKAP